MTSSTREVCVEIVAVALGAVLLVALTAALVRRGAVSYTHLTLPTIYSV